MRKKLIRKFIKANAKASLYNRECTGSGNNNICNCKKQIQGTMDISRIFANIGAQDSPE